MQPHLVYSGDCEAALNFYQSCLGGEITFKTPGMPGPSGFCGFSLSVSYDDGARGERIFKALSEGGQISTPFAATFWAKGFGMCMDKFGVPWMVNCE